MAAAGDVWSQILFDIWEDPAEILGLIGIPDFITMLNLTLIDFFRDTCLYQIIQTQAVFSGQGRYQYPDQMMRVDEAYLGGLYLEPTSVERLRAEMRNWRTDMDTPIRWHSDQLPIQTVEIAPLPILNSSFVVGPNPPDLPYAQTGSFRIVAQSGLTEQPEDHGALTLVGPMAAPQVTELASPILYLPDDFAIAYLPHGVLQRIYSSDSELKDLSLAEYHGAMYDEGVAILKGISGEPSPGLS